MDSHFFKKTLLSFELFDDEEHSIHDPHSTVTRKHSFNSENMVPQYIMYTDMYTKFRASKTQYCVTRHEKD